MQIKLGLRLRVALTLALACLLVVAALGFTLYIASEEMEQALIDQIIAEEMDYLVGRHRQNAAYIPQSSSNLQGYIVPGAHGRAGLPAHLRGLNPGRHVLDVNNIEHHVLIRETAGIRYYVEYEVDLHEAIEDQFKRLVLLSVLTAALVSLALGYWLSGLLVYQVTDLARRVGTLEPGESHQVLTRPNQDPEVATLARAFEGYHARFDQLIRREQEFTSNASHELRTPLTAIRTSCELLLAEPTLVAKTRERVEQINAAAGHMTEQIQALLFLARGQAPGGIEPVALTDCVDEAIEPYRAEIARKAISLEVHVGRDAVLEVDYQALRLVLSNLIRNAVQHTERGRICLTFAARRLTISDSGRGIVQESLPRIFERFYSGGADGLGLGLAIVQRICDLYGWRIEVESKPAAGSSFSVTFP